MDYLIGGVVGLVAGGLLSYFFANKIAAAAVKEYDKIKKAL